MSLQNYLPKTFSAKFLERLYPQIIAKCDEYFELHNSKLGSLSERELIAGVHVSTVLQKGL